MHVWLVFGVLVAWSDLFTRRFLHVRLWATPFVIQSMISSFFSVCIQQRQVEGTKTVSVLMDGKTRLATGLGEVVDSYR